MMHCNAPHREAALSCAPQRTAPIQSVSSRGVATRRHARLRPATPRNAPHR